MEAGTEKWAEPRVSFSLAVKKYVKASVSLDHKEMDPAELRTKAALIKTLHHLVHDILPREDRPFTDVHHFMWDRTRAIRQDITHQVSVFGDWI